MAAVVDVTPRRVIIVSEAPSARALLATFLRNCGVYEVIELQAGASALAVMQRAQKPFDCVLADLSEDTLYLLQDVRCGKARPTRADLCFILMSDEWTSGRLSLARELDVSGIIAKPVDPSKLHDQLLTARKRYYRIDVAKYANVNVHNY